MALQTALADKLLGLKVRSTLVAQIGVEAATISVSAAHGKVVLDAMTSSGSLPAFCGGASNKPGRREVFFQRPPAACILLQDDTGFGGPLEGIRLRARSHGSLEFGDAPLNLICRFIGIL
jgi:hypothetical protein